MIEALAYFVGIGLVFGAIVAVVKGDSGCGGNCKQGRFKCDCKNIF